MGKNRVFEAYESFPYNSYILEQLPNSFCILVLLLEKRNTEDNLFLGTTIFNIIYFIVNTKKLSITSIIQKIWLLYVQRIQSEKHHDHYRNSVILPVNTSIKNAFQELALILLYLRSI